MAGGAGLQSADRPVVSQREVAASFTRSESQVKKAITKEQIDLIRKIQQQRAEAGGRTAALELAKQDVEARKTVKRWEGGPGKPIGEIFRNPNIGAEVADQVDVINRVMQGLDLLALDGPRRAAHVAELKARGIIGASETTASLTSAAVKTIAKLQILDVLYPDIAAAGLTPAQKLDWVERGIARDPVLRQAISELMGAWHDGVLSMPEVQSTQAQENSNETKLAKAKKQNARDNMDSVIRDVLKINKKMTKAQGEALTRGMESGNKDLIVSVLAEVRGVTPAELIEVNNWNENTKRLEDFRAKRANANPQTTQYDVEIDRLEKLVDQAKYPPGNTLGVTITPPAKLGDVNGIRVEVNGQVFSQNLKDYGEQADRIITLTSTKLVKSEKELTADLARKDKERSSLAELETVLDSALIRSYEQREGELADAKQSAEQTKIDEASKAGRMDEAKMRTGRAKRWIEKKGPGLPEEVHLTNIREDINLMREYGQIGIKLLIARDSGIISTKEFNAVRDHKKSAYIALAEVTTEDNQRLEKLLQIEGIMEDYRDTLMTDYLRANKYIKQGVIGRAISYGVGKNRLIQLDADDMTWDDHVARSRFALRPNEWEDLYGHFEESIRTAIDKNKEAQSFLNKLRSEGVVSEPKMRWMVYMLMLMGVLAVPGLGVAGVGAVTGAAGVEAAGLAAAAGGGLAGLKVGQATKDQIIQ